MTGTSRDRHSNDASLQNASGIINLLRPRGPQITDKRRLEHLLNSFIWPRQFPRIINSNRMSGRNAGFVHLFRRIFHGSRSQIFHPITSSREMHNNNNNSCNFNAGDLLRSCSGRSLASPTTDPAHITASGGTTSEL